VKVNHAGVAGHGNKAIQVDYNSSYGFIYKQTNILLIKVFSCPVTKAQVTTSQ